MDHTLHRYNRLRKKQNPWREASREQANSMPDESSSEGRSTSSTSTADLELKPDHLNSANHHAGLASSTILHNPKKRPSRRSTSSMDKTLNEIRSIGRSLQTFLATQAKDDSTLGNEPTTRVQSQGVNWLRRATSSNPDSQRRPSILKMLPPFSGPSRPSTASQCSPCAREEPPPFLHTPTGGDAARASAAAAQNEIIDPSTSSTPQLHVMLRERCLISDSESGIGIEVRDRTDESAEVVVPIARTDPSRSLPPEIMEHVMSYLDAASLINADLVSQRWHNLASSSHIWKHVFVKEFGPPDSSPLNRFPSKDNGGLGLGKSIPNQDWRNLWKVRKQLHDRWTHSSAAAIYLEGHKDSVYCVQFDEQKIVTGSRDRSVRIWDAHTYKCLQVLGRPPRYNHIHGQIPPLVNRTNNGTKPTISITHLQAIAPTHLVNDLYHTGSVLCLQFDADGMVTGSSDHTCIVWSGSAEYGYEPVQRLCQHSAGVLDVCIDKNRVVSCSKDTTICVWDRQSGELLRTLRGHNGPVNAVQMRGDLVVSASGDTLAKLWNLTSGLCIKEFPSKDRGMACVEFSPDSRTIFAGGNDQVIHQFDANTGELIRELKGHKGLVRSLHLDSANGRLISGSYDTSVKAYDAMTGETICSFTGWTTSWILSAKSDYRKIVATSQDSRVVIVDFGHGLPGVEQLER